MRIDAHQHFWRFDEKIYPWIGEKMSILKRDFLPAEAKALLLQNDFHGCVAIQADQSEDETNFLINLSKQNDIIKGVVGWVDLKSPKVEERLSHFSQFPIVKGFRHLIQDEKEDNFILDKNFRNGLKQLLNFEFTYDILVYPRQLAGTLEIVKKYPNQRFVIDHLAKPPIKSGEIQDWARFIKKIGYHENVMCKISGMVTEAEWFKWSYDNFIAYLDVVFESFSVDRIMFGSDWPVCLLAADYCETVEIVNEFISNLSLIEQDKVFGLNAIKFYGL